MINFWEGWLSRTGSIFLGLRKAAASHSPQQFFTRDCDVIFRDYCVSIVIKICRGAAPVHGGMAKFAGRWIAGILFPGYYYGSFRCFCSSSGGVELPVRGMPRAGICRVGGRWGYCDGPGAGVYGWATALAHAFG